MQGQGQLPFLPFCSTVIFELFVGTDSHEQIAVVYHVDVETVRSVRSSVMEFTHTEYTLILYLTC